MPRTGGNAHKRRRARRSAERRSDRSARLAVEQTVAAELEALDFASLVAAATGSTSLPLSDQGRAWDASAADKRVRSWAGADDAPNAKYGSAFFWKASDGGDNFGDYKLGFADIIDGKLTAVWRGVTAVAGVLQGARGGVEGLSDSDRASIKAKVEAYYRKAATQYDDSDIKPPWDANESAGETAAFLLAYADFGPWASDLELCDVIRLYAEQLGDAATVERLGDVDSEEAAAGALEDFGGRPSSGTKPDRRLKENRPEMSALARLAEFQNGVLCQCGHSYAEHVGATGTCSHEDGRGTCTCGSFADADSETLVAAAGDVAWGPEDGFLDLLGDVNEILSGSNMNMADGGGYLRAVDVGVGLDKVLICDYDGDTWSAPITIDGDGEPVLADQAAWLPVEQGWVEVAEADDEDDDDDSAPSVAEASILPRAGELSGSWLRFSLRNLVFADNEVELPDEHRPGARVPKIRSSPLPSDPTPPVGAANGIRAWEATFVPEGTLTDDGRAFAPGSLEWRELPLTLMAMINTSAEGGHDGALVSGRIDRMWREGSLIRAAGVFDEGEYGTDIARMVGDGTLRGLSVDIAIHEYEVGPVSDYFSEDGVWRTDAPATAASERSPADLLFGGSDERQIFVVTKGVIGMATVCPFPAFAEASIALLASGAGFRYSHEGGFITSLRPLVAAAIAPAEAESEEADAAEEALTAAAAGHAPVAPPAEWFANPKLEELTALSIDDDGRIYGHAWAWDTCHIAFADACVLAPRSQTENAYFHLGEIECADGERLSVGKVTLDAPHAGQRLSRGDATAHYDHTGTVAGHVRCGEDEFGGWVAGAVSPDLSEEKLRLLRGSVLSGDWRSVNGNLELVALLAVNVPGFPVPRTRALVASGDDGREVLSLTAAGIVLERTDEDDLAAIAALAAQARG